MTKEMNTDGLILRPITDSDWKNYISHVINDNEVYIQYGYEPEPGFNENGADDFNATGILRYEYVKERNDNEP